MRRWLSEPGIALMLALGLAQPAVAPAVFAQSAPQAALASALAAYATLSPIPAKQELDLAQAEEVQRMLVLNLRPRWGEIAGYKAALTSPAAQARFGVSHPVTGVLLQNMFTSTGSIIDMASAVRPVVEADLLVRVSDARINSAADEAQILENISEVVPFVEVADLMYSADAELDGPSIVAINAGARFGVMGAPIAISAIENPNEALGRFRVDLFDAGGAVIGTGEGAALMGHPLTAALWLKNDLARQGYELKAGDLLSLGSLTRPLPAKGLERVTATYTGLIEAPISVHIGFRDGP